MVTQEGKYKGFVWKTGTTREGRFRWLQELTKLRNRTQKKSTGGSAITLDWEIASFPFIQT